jgi:acyl transferase domain-containing protein
VGETASNSKEILARALRELKEMKVRLAHAQQEKNEPIAVIGLACRFPGDACTPADYWQLLHQGVDAISEIPADRWPVDSLYDPDPDVAGKMSTRYGGFIKDVGHFDPTFFGIAPREVPGMDPQHRLCLEVSWEALEHAGLTAAGLLDSLTGVFMGIATQDYAHLFLSEARFEDIDAYSLTGNSANVAAGRIAYLLGLQGPAMAVDTACSSSLVALHLACQSLRNRECDAALAGGVNLILSPVNNIAFSRMKAMAAGGACKAFDAGADGYIRGEGCGVIVLKRLADAVAAGDNVLALVRGSAVNQDGRSSGLTVPNGRAQEAVIRRALDQADVKPAQVGYVEAHGTGTPLGDPIELQSLGAVYGEARAPDTPLQVGSVKTNFGHLEAAAGIAGVIKVVLSLGQGTIPPHLHFKEPTPRVDWSRLPLRVPVTAVAWQPINGRRLAGVSSFGFSGTNAHVIVEEWTSGEWRPAVAASGPVDDKVSLFTLSAKSEAQLQAAAAQMVEYLGQEDIASLEQICYTGHVRRSHWQWRLAAVAASKAELRRKLAGYLKDERVEDVTIGVADQNRPAKVTFFFSGQGGQRTGMGAGLYRSQPAFRQAFDECAGLAAGYLERPLAELCFAPDREGEPFPDQVTAQIALFSLQVALSRLWQSWGVAPAIVLGQSMGEFAAAVVAGVFKLETALELVARRAQLTAGQTVAGDMAVIRAAPETVAAHLAPYQDRVWLAGQNTAQEAVVGGHATAVAQLLADCQAAGVQVRTLPAFARAGVASHTPLMQPVMDALRPYLEQAEMERPRLDFISSLTGTLLDEEVTAPRYWSDQSQQPFNLSKAVATWLEQGSTLAVEIGPAAGTLGAARRSAPDAAVRWLPSLRENREENEQTLAGLAALYAHGVVVDWAAFHGQQRYQPVDLPFTPFQRRRYWLPGRPAGRPGPSRPNNVAPDQLLLGERLPSPLAAIQFSATLDAHSLDFLIDHQVHDTVLMAGAAHVARVIAGARAIYGTDAILLEDVHFARPLILTENELRQVQLVYEPQTARTAAFRIASAVAGEAPARWLEHVTGRAGHQDAGSVPEVAAVDLAVLQSRCREKIATGHFYDSLQERGYRLGPSFRRLEAIRRRDGEAVARLRLPPAGETASIPPGVLDACFQLLTAAWPASAGELLPTYVPYSVDRLRWRRRPATALYCHAVLRPESSGGKTVVGDVTLFDEHGHTILEVAGLHARPLAPADLRRVVGGAPFYQVQWQPAPIRDQISSATGRWLLFADNAGVANAVAEQLAASCFLVTPAGSFARLSDARWQIRPTEPEDYRQLLAALTATGEPIAGILHLWSLNREGDGGGDGMLESGDWPADQVWGCESVLLLLQALAHTPQLKCRLRCVTAGTQAVPDATAGEQDTGWPAPVHGGLWGLGPVVASEHPELWGGLIDLPPDAPETMAGILREEIRIGDAGDRIAWRGGSRYAARLALLPPDAPATALPVTHPDATYLVTGGLGFLGLHLANWLVAQGARHLVLLGRRAPGAAAQEQVSALQQQGVEVKVRPVDVGDLVALTAVFEEIEATMPPLKGIFHLAGLLGDATLLRVTRQQWRRVAAPKLQGAWNLHRLAATATLDHFVLFSSAAALLGPPGQAAYAAANAAMDALAHYRRARGLPATTINWGGWGGGGLAAPGYEGARWREWGIEAIEPAEGMAYLQQLLAQPWTQTVVLPGRFQFAGEAITPPFLSLLVSQTTPSRNGSPGNREAGAGWRERLLKAPAGQRRALLLQQLQEEASRILRLPPASLPDVNRPLHELGLDSLMAVELRNALVQATGRSLPVTLLFDYPSPAAMADYLLGELFPEEPAAASAAGENERAGDLAAEISALSEDEALTRLVESLSTMEKERPE